MGRTIITEKDVSKAREALGRYYARRYLLDPYLLFPGWDEEPEEEQVIEDLDLDQEGKPGTEEPENEDELERRRHELERRRRELERQRRKSVRPLAEEEEMEPSGVASPDEPPPPPPPIDGRSAIADGG